MKKINLAELKHLFEKSLVEEKATETAVQAIIDRVKKDTDSALVHFARRYDGVKLKGLKAGKTEIDNARRALDGKLLEAVKAATKRIEAYHEKQLPENFKIKESGITAECRFAPVEKAGIYIPGGQAPLISTVLMTVIPAKIAGVKNIAAASPPSFDGRIHPSVLGILGHLGIKDVFAMGGAQAIAAFAFGTETVPQVDMVAGPGNKYVNAAKKLLYGKVGLDLPAGPSEVVIFADSSADASLIAADLAAQAEHTDGKSIFITTSGKLGYEVSRKIKEGFWLETKNAEEAVEIINYIAPEHLQLICKNPGIILRKAKAGAVFIGEYSPAALGDYFAGPSHVLPTGRTARFASGLSVYTFLRNYAVIEAKKAFYEKHASIIETLARSEGLKKHAESVADRKGDKGK